MSSFIINFTSQDGTKTGSVPADGGFWYTDKLNDLNEAQVKLTGSGSVLRSLFEMGSVVEIKRDGTREFYGVVVFLDYLDGGAVVADVKGYEWWLGKENGDYANSPWQNTASATIFGDLIGESTKLTAGTVEAGTLIDFRVSLTDSLWNGISNLARKTGQDVQIDYVNLEVDVLDNRGSLTSVLAFNDKIDIQNLRYSQGYPTGNDVRVYGKGDGVNQIKSDESSSGQDASSKSTYGTIRKPVIDRSVLTIAEADKLADATVAITKDPAKIYDFDVINPNQSLIGGDVITLNSKDKDLTSEAVRVTGIRRGMIGGRELLSMQVSNAAYSRLIKDRNTILNEMRKAQRDSDTYMQGSGNTLTFGQGLNAKSGQPYRLIFQLPAAFIQDEAGKLRVDSFTLDFDIDPFNKQYGGSTFDGSDPQVQNISGNTGPDVTGSTSSSPMTWTGVFRDTANNGGAAWSAGWNTDVLGGAPGILGVQGDNIPYFGVFIRVKADASFSDTIAIKFRWDKDGALYTKIIQQVIGNTAIDDDFIYQWFWVPYQDHTEDADVTLDEDLGFQLDFYTSGGVKYTISCTIVQIDWTHSHGDGTLAAASHGHPDGTYDINAADINNISIGDGVGEAGSVNASDSTIKLYHWSGAAWDLELTINNAGLIDTDVDLTNINTLPDAVGWWKIEIEPDNATPDFVQAIVKLKHSLDS